MEDEAKEWSLVHRKFVHWTHPAFEPVGQHEVFWRCWRVSSVSVVNRRSANSSRFCPYEKHENSCVSLRKGDTQTDTGVDWGRSDSKRVRSSQCVVPFLLHWFFVPKYCFQWDQSRVVRMRRDNVTRTLKRPRKWCSLLPIWAISECYLWIQETVE